VSILPIVARQRLDKYVPTAMNTHTIRIVGRVVLYVIYIVSKESRRLVHPATSPLYSYTMIYFAHHCIKKGKTIPVTVRGGP
jgi:hypothetical protein